MPRLFEPDVVGVVTLPLPFCVETAYAEVTGAAVLFEELTAVVVFTVVLLEVLLVFVVLAFVVFTVVFVELVFGRVVVAELEFEDTEPFVNGRITIKDKPLLIELDVFTAKGTAKNTRAIIIAYITFLFPIYITFIFTSICRVLIKTFV